MGILDRVERGLERAVKAPFARVFKAEVQPVEIASAMRGAMDERAAVLGPGRTMVPNVFTVELAKSDFERLASYEEALTDELVAAVEDHAQSQRYTPAGPMEVRLSSDEELETGIFRVRPVSKNARKAQRQGQQGRPDPRQGQRPPQQGRPGPGGQGRPPAGAPPQGQGGMPSRPGGGPARPPQRSGGQAPAGVGAAGAAAMGGGRPPGTRPPGSEGPSTREFQPARPPQRPAQPGTGGPWIDVSGRRHELRTAVTTLGRDNSADIVVDDPGVSRRHAELRITHDGPHLQVFVRDLGSTNGTYLNGDQVGNEQLQEGDRLTIGRSTVTFHLDGGR